MKLFIIFITILYPTISQQLQIVDFNFDEPPVAEALIRLTESGQNLNIIPENIVITESNKSPMIIETIQSGVNLLTVRWIPHYDQFVFNDYFFRINYFNDNKTFSASFDAEDLNIPFVSFTDLESGFIQRKIDFGEFKTIRQVAINVRRGRVINGGERDVFLDSLYMNDGDFRYFWQGKLGPDNGERPPMSADVGGRYIVNFRIDSSNSSAPYFDIFNVVYDNGVLASIPVLARPIKLEKNQSLRLLKPNGGETFSPCQIVEVEWEGSTPGLAIDIVLEGSDGDSLLGTSTTNSFTFSAPPNYDENYRIRVAQKFNISSARRVNKANYTPLKVALNEISNYMAAINSQNNLVLVNTGTNTIISDFFLSGVPAISAIKSFFFSDNDIVIHYVSQGSEYITIVNPISRETLQTFQLENRYQKLILDSENKMLYSVPEFGRKIDVISIESYQIVESVQFDNIISSADINFDENLITISSYNGIVAFYDLNTNTKSNEFNLGGLAYINNLTVSPNGNIVALSLKFDETRAIPSEIVIFDRVSNSVITIIEGASVDPLALEFSPSSNFLVIGSANNPKVLIYDLTEGSFEEWGDFTGTMNDLDFSEGAPLMAIAAQSSNRPLQYVDFSFPEIDRSDSTFTIREPELLVDTIIFPDNYFYHSDEELFTGFLCNIDTIPLIIDNVYLNDAIHFTLTSTDYPDILLPGDCLEFSIENFPRDTGLIEDKVVIESCGLQYDVIIQGFGIPRNLEPIEPVLNSGEICVGDTLDLLIELFTNRDPVDVNINGLIIPEEFRDIISIENNTQEQNLGFDENYRANIRFTPQILGLQEVFILVRYESQDLIYQRIYFNVLGIGTRFDLSLQAIPFIQQDPVRTLTITNPGNFEVNLLNIRTEPVGIFQINQIFPQIIQPGASIDVPIIWNGDPINGGIMIFDADPCPLQKSIPMDEWSGSMLVFSEDIIADNPSAEVSIPIYYSLTNNYNYGDELSFSTFLELNPRIFFPLEIESKYEVSFENLGIENDLRRIKVDVSGDFSARDTFAILHGVAGIAETDITNISFDEFDFPDEITVSGRISSLRVDSICGTRRIFQNGVQIELINAFPNPSDSQITLEMTSNEDISVNISLYSGAGDFIYRKSYLFKEGMNTTSENLNKLPVGVYYLLVESDDSTPLTINFTITR